MAALLADHNFSRPVVLLLRRRGHDAVTSRELGLDRSSDGAHLLRAALLGRTLLSNNERDFVLLHDAWLRWAAAWGIQPQHAGIIILPQRMNWSAERAADEIERVIGSGSGSSSRQSANTLWRWRSTTGWVEAGSRADR